jgi:DNA replication protein
LRVFGGFEESDTRTGVPDSFFREVLSIIRDSAEFKVVLHAIWRLERMDGEVRALTDQDFDSAQLGLSPQRLKAGLTKAIEHGLLLRTGRGNLARYFLNSTSGRASLAALEKGGGAPTAMPSSAPLERPNLFRVYEENIGPLTPLIADALKAAESDYPAEWLQDAIELAVKNNKRSWSYCEAILRRWKEEGRGKEQNRRDDQAARQRDVEEKIRRFIRG